MDDKVRDYLDFLKYCLNSKADIPACVERINWGRLLDFATKQSIVGVYWEGVKRLSNIPKNKPSEDDVMVWMGEAVKLKRQGCKLDAKTTEVTKILRDDGFDCCVLKGQTNNRFYPSPYSRTPGDIDIWVNGSRKEVLHYVTNKLGHTDVEYHHLTYPIYDDIPVEAHIYPVYSTNPFNNIRIQKFFKSEARRQMSNVVKLANGNEVYGLTDDVNIIFQLMHMHKHVCTEGLGLRQVIDYYYLIEHARIDDSQWVEIIKKIKKFHLFKFFTGILYILHSILGLDIEKIRVQESKTEGEYILSQILQGGNFGKYNARLKDYREENNHVLRYIKLMKLLLSRWKHYPYEVSWQPLFFIVNWVMMNWYKWRYNL